MTNHEIMDTLSNLQTKLRETIDRYRSELPGRETNGAGSNRTATSENAAGTDGTEVNEQGDAGNPGNEMDRHRQTEAGEGTKRAGPNGEKTRNAGDEWRPIESPTNKALYGVVHTARGLFAVGIGGLVLTRGERGWHAVIEAGPATRENRLTAIDVTDDGKRIWFCGSSGALGAYDVETGHKYDYSAPKDKTSTWEAIAVTGKADSETLRVANGSGEVLPASTDENGCPQWEEVTKPGSGSTISALDFGGGDYYAADTSGNVFVEREDGWKDIGIEDAQVNFFDVFATGDRVLVAGGSGWVYRYERACRNWTPIEVGEGALHAIDDVNATPSIAGAGGRIYERTGTGWQRTQPVSEDLFSVALGGTKPDVAVGANGTIVERSEPGRTAGDGGESR